jgi:tungstate transport system substrate-binding protein
MTAKYWLFLVPALFLSHCDHRTRDRAVEIATTTSLQGSGLLDVLSGEFKRQTGLEVHAFVVGSGQAMNLARKGTVDLIITHDAESERKLVAATHPQIYRQFMWNDFVVVGPASDPAAIRKSRTAPEAFRRIDERRARFCSRNDQSGTHMKELDLWRRAGVDPMKNPQYFRMGQPMAYLLRSADELQAYVLSDRATFDALAPKLKNEILFGGDPLLRNVYALTLMHAGKGAGTEHAHAERFAAWLLTEGRRVVESFRIRGHREFFWIADD